VTKVIGVDIDDTTLELMPTWLALHNAGTGESLTPDHVTDWGLHQFTPQGEAIYEVLGRPGLYDSVQGVEGAIEGLRMLRKSYRVVFVTANEQPTFKEKRNCLVRNGLVSQQDVRKDSIVAFDKTLARVDLLIDDCAENVENFPGPAILFDRPWNRAWRTPKSRTAPVVRCFSWTTIPNFVDVLLEYTAGKAEGRWT
jgi:5'(3')-deoxyribonucleotidase